ncbi:MULTISPECIES: hypothetical protein [unclassified Mesorhizobium]|uniref:hypothetical protein n=1 Tax=unclassified Mesorhizobium TaxID=325217 RepID=UPI000FD4E187|nr:MULTISPECIES: hypothetical protein [unclassified Mesorhizobium]RUV04213.1 hypothetical protein EOA79_15255 [Mesorhizobium sp. M1A.F.Ca.IN.020.03.2.1]RWG87106.1 MAG: hypothetical protein EOQ70_13730 [Mesorhizobium sp.]RWK18256.1 MAG: hypothetical protein EOR41_14005 [Mesorhizobium sp.]
MSAWLIQGYDGLELMFQRRFSPVFSEREIAALLQRLAARDLSVAEVFNASLRRSMKEYSPFLEVKRESGPRVVLSCGENRHYTASMPHRCGTK